MTYITTENICILNSMGLYYTEPFSEPENNQHIHTRYITIDD